MLCVYFVAQKLIGPNHSLSSPRPGQLLRSSALEAFDLDVRSAKNWMRNLMQRAQFMSYDRRLHRLCLLVCLFLYLPTDFFV